MSSLSSSIVTPLASVRFGLRSVEAVVEAVVEVRVDVWVEVVVVDAVLPAAAVTHRRRAGHPPQAASTSNRPADAAAVTADLTDICMIPPSSVIIEGPPPADPKAWRTAAHDHPGVPPTLRRYSD